MEEIDDVMYMDKSVEYWAGWALAFYQWYSAKSFSKIFRSVSIHEILRMYPVFHKMHIMKFVDAMNEIIRQFYPEINLKRIRCYEGYSPKELAYLLGVSIRQIQLFEQRQRDINQSQALSIANLGRVFGCCIEDLLEI